MKIETATSVDLDSVSQLVFDVSNKMILPHLNEQGKQTFVARVIPDLSSTFGKANYLTLKAVMAQKLVGFAALRDGDYLTHLFVASDIQGKGVGRSLLNALLSQTQSNHVSLRSSVNAVSFYRQLGFVETDEESDFEGIRFVPMSLRIF